MYQGRAAPFAPDLAGKDLRIFLLLLECYLILYDRTTENRLVWTVTWMAGDTARTERKRDALRASRHYARLSLRSFPILLIQDFGGLPVGLPEGNKMGTRKVGHHEYGAVAAWWHMDIPREDRI